jgi:hypothetical protein
MHVHSISILGNRYTTAYVIFWWFFYYSLRTCVHVLKCAYWLTDCARIKNNLPIHTLFRHCTMHLNIHNIYKNIDAYCLPKKKKIIIKRLLR